ncbi:MAG TPA: ABC transporter permease [Cyclobacteriaceae bacterium]|nr:ABC transporter permease [Cyclobacteriaceae bacterium]
MKMPPRLFHRFFRWYCHPKLRDGIEGDLIEFYRERVKRSGKRTADFLFAIDVLLLLRPAIIKPVEGHKEINQYGMLKNYFTIGWRNLRRNKGYSAINIGGLAAGMAVTILIGLWIVDELSFNKSFQNYDRVGHVMVHNGEGTYPSNPIPLEAELRTNFSDDIKFVTLSSWPQEYSVTQGDKKFLERGMFMQPDGAEIFSLDMVYGTRKALTEPNTIMIAQSLSQKLFGDADPIGQVVRIKNLIDVRVGAVYRDFPSNTDLNNLSFIGSWDFLLSWMTWIKEEQDRWDNNSYKFYVQLQDGVSFEDVSAKIKDLKMKHLDEERREGKPELFVHPMSRWHLYSKFVDRKIVTSEQLQFVWLYGIIGSFVLLLACINFMNLSTARSEKRAKEVGIRKTMGSLRKQLIAQFFSESFITVGIALIASLLIVAMSLPFFNEIAAKKISIPWSGPEFWMAIVGFALAAGVLAGSYPALYLSSFKPVRVLKGSFHSGRLASLPRKILVVVQFSVSVCLIVGTVVVYQQIQFAKNRPVGYSQEGLVTVYMITPDLYQHYQVIRTELLQLGAVQDIASSSAPVTEIWSNNSGLKWDGIPEGMESNFALNWVSQPYGKTVGWQFLQGRDFSEEIASDSTAVIINRAAVKYMGMDDPIDQVIQWDEDRYHVVGVIEDVVMGSPYRPVLPTLFLHSSKNIYTINIRLNPSLGAQEAIAAITPVFRKYNPSVPFQYKFVDEEYERKFASEVRVGTLASIFAGLAIFISLLGLFGLSSFVAEQRTKEIGIRKVVGASLFNLWSLLTRSFAVLVMIACVVAFPIAWYFLSNWLVTFEYRIGIQWWLFPAVAAGALAVTLITVSYQAIRAALINPVESLKSE